MKIERHSGTFSVSGVTITIGGVNVVLKELKRLSDRLSSQGLTNINAVQLPQNGDSIRFKWTAERADRSQLNG